MDDKTARDILSDYFAIVSRKPDAPRDAVHFVRHGETSSVCGTVTEEEHWGYNSQYDGFELVAPSSMRAENMRTCGSCGQIVDERVLEALDALMR